MRDEPAGRPSALDRHVGEWLDERRAEIERSPSPYPVYLVAAQGGGIRAAYWSAGVLAAWHDASPQFTRRTLALSGVSGGSVGVGVHAALIAATNETARDAQPLRCAADRRLQGCVRPIVGADLLSPPLAAMLLGDLARSGLSSPLLGPLALDAAVPARSRLLEQALEEAFAAATGSDLLADAWNRGWRGTSRLAVPLVLSNATSVTTSQRAVLTPLAGGGPWNGVDLNRVVDPAATPASTALVLSARFPGISTTASHCGERLVDGGYADNSGLGSLADLAAVLRDAARARGLVARIEPIVVALENGVSRTSHRVLASQVAPAASAAPDDARALARGVAASATVLGVLQDPVATFGGLLGANPEAYLALLDERLSAFPMRRIVRVTLPWTDPGEFPLGWVLSPSASATLDRRIAAVAQARAASLRLDAAPR
jgi:hypothetical protein